MEEYQGRYSQQDSWMRELKEHPSEDDYPSKQIRLMFDKELLRKAKQFCDKNGTSLTKMTSQALTEYMKNH
jgi:hypothetical protein